MKRGKVVKTPDDFYPTSPDGTVSVFIHRSKGKGPRNWRVSVWGDDDYGLERLDLDVNEAFNVYQAINDGITIKTLKQLGFVMA